jgi:hypothetical protein
VRDAGPSDEPAGTQFRAPEAAEAILELAGPTHAERAARAAATMAAPQAAKGGSDTGAIPAANGRRASWGRAASEAFEEVVRGEIATASTFTGALVISIPASFLPARWRRHLPPQLPWAAGTMIGGWAEAFVAAASLIATFDRGTIPGVGGGAATFVMHLFSPIGLLCLWHLVEGLARATSAMSAGEPLGSAALWLVGWAFGRIIEARREAHVSPRLPDLVKVDAAGDLIEVAASVPLPWDHVCTIRFEGRLYMVTHADRPVGASHPYVYRLAPVPEQRVVRGMIDFVPFTGPGTSGTPEPG